MAGLAVPWRHVFRVANLDKIGPDSVAQLPVDGAGTRGAGIGYVGGAVPVQGAAR